jgi:anti-anti-sigma factor
MLKNHLQEPSSHLLLDFEALDYISSAGLRVVLNITKIFDQSPWKFAACSMQDHVREVFEISGFDGFITIYHSADDFFDTSE